MSDAPAPAAAPASRETLGTKVRALFVVAALSLITNVLTITRQGIEAWWSSLVSNGDLRIAWTGRAPQGITIQAKSDEGKGVDFDPNETIALPAGRYGITVRRYDKQFPVTLLTLAGVPVTHVQLERWRTTVLTIKPTPTDPLFTGVYDLVADSLGRPKGHTENLKIVYEGFHENGTMLWFYDTNTFYILRANNGSWTDQPGPPYPTDPCLYNQACIDRRDHAPPGLHAPIGGGNGVWRNNAKDLGWVLGYCIYHDAIVSEDFENGFLPGPLSPASFGNVATSVSMETSHHTWRSAILFGKKSAACA